MSGPSLPNKQGFSVFRVRMAKTPVAHDESLTYDANLPNAHFEEQPRARGRGIKLNQPWNMNISSFHAHPATDPLSELYSTPWPSHTTDTI
jgi:hypothetical protein